MRVEIKEDRVTQRLTAYLVGQQQRGAKRSTLQQRFRLNAVELDNILLSLRQQQGFREWKPEGSHATFYSYIPPEPLQAEDGLVRCVWCRKLLPAPASPGTYCSSSCNAAAASASLDLGALIDGAPSPYAAFEISVDVVCADLRARGFGIYRAGGSGVRFAVVGEHANVLYGVRVVPATVGGALFTDPSWTTPGSNTIIVHVLPQGRLVYQGLPAGTGGPAALG